MSTPYEAAVQRALLDANDAMAQMADRALADCPTGRRLLIAALDAPCGGKAARKVAETVGIPAPVLTSRLHRAHAPSAKDLTTHVFRMRAAYLLWTGAPQGVWVDALGLGAPQNFGTAVERLVSMTPRQWVRSTTPAEERAVFWDFLRSGDMAWRQVALTPARSKQRHEVTDAA